MDVLGHCLIVLHLGHRHLASRPPVVDVHLLGTEAKGSASSIERHISATDDRHPAPDSYLFAHFDIAQESQPVVEVFHVLQFARYAYALASLSAGSDKDRFKAVFPQVFYGEIHIDGHVVSYLDATLGDIVYLTLNNLPGQAKLRYCYRKHASPHWKGFEDCNRIAHLSQEVGATQPGGPGSDYSYSLVLGLGEGFWLEQFSHMIKIPVGGKAFELPYGY